jgi:hypothetical protein
MPADNSQLLIFPPPQISALALWFPRRAGAAAIAAALMNSRRVIRSRLGTAADRSEYPFVSNHRQDEASGCLAFAISATPLASMIFRFTLPRLQKAKALLGSSRTASL